MWAQIINAFLGIWIMASPAIIGQSAAASDNSHIIGPIIITFAVVSWWEATRIVRLYNVPFGAWLVLAPWILGYEATAMIASSMISGVLVVLLSFVKGTVKQQFGGGWSSLWK